MFPGSCGPWTWTLTLRRSSGHGTRRLRPYGRPSNWTTATLPGSGSARRRRDHARLATPSEDDRRSDSIGHCPACWLGPRELVLSRLILVAGSRGGDVRGQLSRATLAPQPRRPTGHASRTRSPSTRYRQRLRPAGMAACGRGSRCTGNPRCTPHAARSPPPTARVPPSARRTLDPTRESCYLTASDTTTVLFRPPIYVRLLTISTPELTL